MKASLKLTPASITSFKQSLTATTLRVTDAADASLGNAASRAFAAAQSRTPRVTGALAASGQLSSSNSGNLLRRTISYGDSTTNPRTGIATSEYAARVHEVFHPEHPNSYKWLEYSIRDYGKEEFMANLAASLRAIL